MDVIPATSHSAFKLNNPELRYQLDPGEPGLLRNAKASTSQMAVSAQERGNLNQFRREAYQAGRMVIYQSITFTRAIDGLFNSIRAGLTEVVSVPLPKHERLQLVKQPDIEIETHAPAVSEQPVENIADKQIELLNRLAALRENIAQTPVDMASREQLLEKIEELNSGELDFTPLPMVGSKLMEEIEDLNPVSPKIVPMNANAYGELELDIGTKPVEIDVDISIPGQDQLIRHEIEMRELAEKLHEIEMLRLSDSIEQLNNFVTDAIRENVSLLTNLIAVANHVGPDSHFNDPSSSVPILGTIIDTAI